MSEWISWCVLLGLIAGQLFAVTRGRFHAIVFYYCVAPLNYFQIWAWGSWDSSRMCALALISGGVALRWKVPQSGFVVSIPLLALACYGSVVTLVAMPYWPVLVVSGQSAVYAELRGVVQIANWLIMLAMAWHTSIALGEVRCFRKLRSILCLLAVAHCVYAAYQVVAIKYGLPSTGTRRPSVGSTSDLMGEEFAVFVLQGVDVLRPCSFVGEPKSLAAACNVWFALLLSRTIDQRMTYGHGATLVMVVVTLWLTASTSGWAVFAAIVAIFALVQCAQPRSLARVIALLVVIAMTGVLAVLLIDPHSTVSNVIGAMFESRWSERIATPLGDLPEELAIDILKEAPELALFGCGLGGVSFFIADKLATGAEFILFPNNGLLGIVCNIGCVGLLIYVLAWWPGLRSIVGKGRGGHVGHRLQYAIVACACVVQVLSFGELYISALGLGLCAALARGIREQEVGSYAERDGRKFL